jgi:hypothetical protein
MSGGAAAALQWPVAVESMSSSFLDDGDDGSGRAEPFVEFEGYESMRPFDTGEVVFRYGPDDFGTLPGAGEAILVLEHENGFQSIYSGIDEQELRTDREKLSVGEFLKAPEDGGEPGFCRFTIRDAQLNQLVNPFVLLPSIEDKTPPEIRSVLLVRGADDFELAEDLSLKAGRYNVYVDGRDPFGKGMTRMPYAYFLYNLGSLMLERQLDAVRQDEHGLAFKDGQSVDSVFSRRNYVYLGTVNLTSGQSDLEISLKDIQGNESSRSYTVQVYR